MKRIALLSLWGLLIGAVQAQTLYRCGPEGRELSQKPCADGQRIDYAAREPTPAEQAAARDVAARDARLADQLQRERQAREAQPRPPAIVIHAGGQAASAASAPPHTKKKKKTKHKPASDGFITVAPRPSKTR